MKPVLDWVKSHLVIVICAAVLIAVPTASFFVSGMLTKGVKDRAAKRAEQAQSQLKSVSTLTYQLPVMAPGEEPFKTTFPPNVAMAARFKAKLDERTALAEGLRSSAVSLNSGGREPLVDNLFPTTTVEPKPVEGAVTPPEGELVGGELVEGEQPSAGVEGEPAIDPTTGLPIGEAPVAEVDPAEVQRARQRQTLLFTSRLLGRRQQRNAYLDVLAKLNMGGPADMARVQQDVTQWTETRRDRMAEESSDRQLTAEQTAELEKESRARLIQLIVDHARGRSLFASPQVFLGAEGLVRPQAEATNVDPVTAFRWQLDLWLLDLVVEAIARANTDSAGLLTGVPESMLKRVDSVVFGTLDTGAGAAGAEGDPMAAAPSGPKEGPTFTGRTPVPAGGEYLARSVTITGVVSSARLPELIQVIEASNLMTVTDISLSEVDVWAELSSGFAYGDEHVMRATLTIEVLMLRAWLDKYMPEDFLARGSDLRAAGDAGGGIIEAPVTTFGGG